MYGIRNHQKKEIFKQHIMDMEDGTIRDEKKAFELYLKSAKVGYRLASIMMEVAFRKIEVKLLNGN